MKYYKLVGILVLALSFSTSAFAESSTSTRPLKKMEDKKEERKDERKAMVASTTEAKCSVIEKRVEERENHFGSSKKENANKYTETVAKLQTLVTSLKAEGKDTAKLEADLATLNTKLAKLNADILVVETKLSATKSFACGTSNGQFKTALKEAEDARKVVLADMKDIKEFVTKTIKGTVNTFRAKEVMEKKENASSTDKKPARLPMPKKESVQ